MRKLAWLWMIAASFGGDAAHAQTARISPSQPKWGEPIEILYDFYRIVPNAESIATRFDFPAYPTHVILNESGAIEARFTGAGDRRPDELRTVIQRSLGKSRNTQP